MNSTVNQMINMRYHTFIILALCSFSCLEKPKSESRKINSELLKKVDAVHQQMMKQGNISDEEREAIQGLAALVSGNGIKDPSDPSSEYYAISFGEVEQIPIYPGCENLDKDKQRQCFVDQLNQFINSEFNRGIFEKLDLSGSQQIDVFVFIDKQGYPSALKVRDTFIELQAEALRVLNKIPRMTPARENNKPVAVQYPDGDIPHQIRFEID